MRGLPEFDLSGKVFVGILVPTVIADIQVTGGAGGLGFVQIGALIEAGAAGVVGFDRLPTPDPKYEDVRKKYPDQLLEYKQVDVTNP